MRGEKIFLNYFATPLERVGVTEVTLRDYVHTRGVFADDPSGGVFLRRMPLRSADMAIDELFLAHNENEDRGIALTSRVRMQSGNLRRLLLLDFAIEVTSQHEHMLSRALFEVATESPAFFGGALMRTTNSYHFFGFTPLRYGEWVRAMGTALLFLGGSERSFVDSRYMGHSLLRGYGSLRISDMDTKETPTFICYIPSP